MIKKVAIAISIVLLSGLFACSESRDTYKLTFFDYMYTFIQISMVTTETDYETHARFIEDTFKMYDALTSSYEPLDENAPYLENVYGINLKIGQTIQIDEPLYDILAQSLQYQTLTDNHFNVLLGKVSRTWKAFIEGAPKSLAIGNNIFIHTYDDMSVLRSAEVISFSALDVTVLLGDVLTVYERDKILYDVEALESEFIKTRDIIDAFAIEENKMTLSTLDGLFFVKVEGKDAQLDLGAMSKGYATEIIRAYLEENDVTYFSVSVGSSTIAVGKNINRPSERYVFNIALTNPNTSINAFKPPYGIIKVRDQAVSTSGNFEQYTVFQGLRYHHIISPFTLYPAQHYQALTIVGKDAGLLDALSTALYVMPFQTLETFMESVKDTLGLEIIVYHQDQTISTFLNALIFEATT